MCAVECGISSIDTDCNCNFPIIFLGCCFLSLVVLETLLNPRLYQPNVPKQGACFRVVPSGNFLPIEQLHRNTSYSQIRGITLYNNNKKDFIHSVRAAANDYFYYPLVDL